MRHVPHDRVPVDPSGGFHWEDLQPGMQLVTIRPGYDPVDGYHGPCVVTQIYPDTSYVQAIAADGRVIERQFMFFFLP